MFNEKMNRIKRIIDISQEVLGCNVYPGDRKPQAIIEKRINDNELYNLSSFIMCAHNGTHIDAPFHFINNGKTIDQLALDKLIGWCNIIEYNGLMTKEDALNVINKLSYLESSKRILFKGQAIITEEAASVFSTSNIYLIGVEMMSVGPLDTPMKVHKILLDKEIILLEGIILDNVKEGIYFLNCAPLNIKGFDGSPCRAILIEYEGKEE